MKQKRNHPECQTSFWLSHRFMNRSCHHAQDRFIKNKLMGPSFQQSALGAMAITACYCKKYVYEYLTIDLYECDASN